MNALCGTQLLYSLSLLVASSIYSAVLHTVPKAWMLSSITNNDLREGFSSIMGDAICMLLPRGSRVKHNMKHIQISNLGNMDVRCIKNIPHMMSLLNSVLIYEGCLNTTDAIFFSMERITCEGTHEFEH